MQIQNKPLPAREMHKIVLIMMGVFSLMAITFPTAMMRVSQMEKFRGFHVKSLPLDLKKPSGESLDVKPVATQSPVAAIASSATVQTALVPVSAGKDEAMAVNPTSQTAEITDLTKLEVLNQKLYNQLDRSWQTSPTFEHNLVYRVSVDSEGAIASYEPLNQLAKDYLKETPLPSLSKYDGGKVEASAIAKFTVVFSPTGVLEVSR